MKPHRLRIKVLSPLHIGTGEVYEPTDFFVHPKGYLGVLDFDKFIAHFSQKELTAFKVLCQKGELSALVKLYQLVDALAQTFLNQGLDDFVLRKVALSRGFLNHYNSLKELLNNPRELQKKFNQFTIYRTAFSPNEKVPIIPGSAVKGAIRTAILNMRRTKAKGRSWHDYCQQRNPHSQPRCNSKRLENDILQFQKFHEDPFRLIKVSDFRPVGEVNTRIVYAVNRKKNGGAGKGPYQILEVVEPGAIFEGEITILPENRFIKNPVTFEEIKEALKNFYKKEYGREFEEVKRIEGDPPVLPEKGFPLRVGRHCGAECVTIEGFRCIVVRERGGFKIKNHATTLWLASDISRPETARGLKPFGWAVLYEAGDEPKTATPEKKASAVNPSKLAQNPRFKIRVKK